MAPIMIPTLLFWENKITWYGSKGLARFFIKPVSIEVAEGKNEWQLHVELWRGPLTKDLSEIIATAAFPMTDDGLAQTTAWLEDQAAQMNA